MSLNDNKGRRHASIYLGDPPVSYGGGDRHSGDRGLCLVARRGIRRCPEMAEIAPSAQGPQGAIAQACQRARRVAANGACEARRLGQARFDSVMRASAAHKRRPWVARCGGGGRTGRWRGASRRALREKRRRTFATKVRVGFASPNAPDRAQRKSVARSVAGPCGPGVARARPLLCRRAHPQG